MTWPSGPRQRSAKPLFRGFESRRHLLFIKIIILLIWALANSKFVNKRSTNYSLASLILIGIIIATIFLDTMAITKLIVIPISIAQLPIAEIRDNQIYQNIYLNLIDTLLFHSSQEYKSKAYKHPVFYNPMDIRHKLICKHLGFKLLNIKAICIWWPSSKNVIDPPSNNCVLYYNSQLNKLICY